ncbi:hypothetical protein TGDOM2_292070 [Toxoplasma gondii GAB2-2007-GAL-DOM2]|uniref:Uncharacterized protein n=3 Tax=Toxoplasma gondii TaxID=5811 RepID=A0A086KBE0_TOXGO|nr:hypothetical protein TGFOU_292070 [Toxoplasma gondii FOU]KFG42101.1 hypothetical protein TGDOM2_292070 [Toxoplasma gondii GAB2-2007-GAL-DOM2]RQX73583.1 hypothetical protein TGCAST_292070 [Toxoplasma gondii CAST]
MPLQMLHSPASVSARFRCPRLLRFFGGHSSTFQGTYCGTRTNPTQKADLYTFQCRWPASIILPGRQEKSLHASADFRFRRALRRSRRCLSLHFPVKTPKKSAHRGLASVPTSHALGAGTDLDLCLTALCASFPIHVSGTAVRGDEILPVISVSAWIFRGKHGATCASVPFGRLLRVSRPFLRLWRPVSPLRLAFPRRSRTPTARVPLGSAESPFSPFSRSKDGKLFCFVHLQIQEESSVRRSDS